MWRYEQEFRIDKPKTEGETDKHFDNKKINVIYFCI